MMIENKNKNKNKETVLQIICDEFKNFFVLENKRLSKDQNIIKFSMRYVILIEKIKCDVENKVNEETMKFVTENDQFFIAAFFGITNVCEPTHIYLKNTRAFFALYKHFITVNEFPSINLNMYEESLKIHNRLNLCYEARTYASISFYQTIFVYSVFIKSYNTEFHSKYSALNLKHLHDQFLITSEKFIQKYTDKNYEISKLKLRSHLRSDDKLYVYRGFEISDDDNVRLKRVKKNNPTSQIQDSGKSICYTLNKEIANKFAMHKFKKTDLFIVEYEERIDRVKLLFDNCDTNFDEFTSKLNRRVYVAKYEINLKDVIVDSCYSDESEVIVLPQNARLIEYRPINYS